MRTLHHLDTASRTWTSSHRSTDLTCPHSVDKGVDERHCCNSGGAQRAPLKIIECARSVPLRRGVQTGQNETQASEDGPVADTVGQEIAAHDGDHTEAEEDQ